LTETPKGAAAGLLEDVLRQVRLKGALILRAEFTEPWAYESPASEDLVTALQLGTQQLILFHLVPEGRCRLTLTHKRDSVDLEGGDVVVIPYGDQHRVGHPDADRPVPINDLLPPMPWSEFPVVRHGGGGARTQFVCGYLACEDLLFNPFLRALPPLFRVRPPGGPAASWIEASYRYALEGATPEAAGRLFELIFVEVMRLYAGGLEPQAAGWLAALGDPVVGRALVHLHAAPTQPWTVAELASRVAVSRSVLDERFRRQLGRPPMRYLTEWRLQLAADLLRSTTHGVAEVAARVGYESEASFNRAFRRLLGQPPARWRERARSAAPRRA
jgi:AraC-like DNA-binding protein